MQQNSTLSSLILGISLLLGLALLGHLIGSSLIAFKEMERSVTVKGLAEREVPADVVIWPIVFTETGNDLEQLYAALEQGKRNIVEFLRSRGIETTEISHAMPAVTDKSAQQYTPGNQAEFRFVAVQTVTVYSSRVDQVREAMASLADLGKRGIVFRGDEYQNQIEYLFTGLNALKPEMIEEATAQARAVAAKFATDSGSRLGRIRHASQGQFSIEPRDRNTPHIKKIRVVSTVEYYLAD